MYEGLDTQPAGYVYVYSADDIFAMHDTSYKATLHCIYRKVAMATVNLLVCVITHKNKVKINNMLGNRLVKTTRKLESLKNWS